MISNFPFPADYRGLISYSQHFSWPFVDAQFLTKGHLSFALRSALCALRSALCALRYALCAMPSALCPLRYALCASRIASSCFSSEILRRG